MAPTEGRVARPERRWGCRRGTPMSITSAAARYLSAKIIGMLNTVCINFFAEYFFGKLYYRHHSFKSNLRRGATFH